VHPPTNAMQVFSHAALRSSGGTLRRQDASRSRSGSPMRLSSSAGSPSSGPVPSPTSRGTSAASAASSSLQQLQTLQLSSSVSRDDEMHDCECVICYETIDVLDAVRLPCDCRVSYCHHCWDRSLAASIALCGRPLCPSCRAAMRVDYDACGGNLLFSRAPMASRGEMEMVDDWRNRLYEQAKPRQIELLKEYGQRSLESSPQLRPSLSPPTSSVLTLEDPSAVVGASPVISLNLTRAAQSLLVSEDPSLEGSEEAEAAAAAGGVSGELLQLCPPRCVCGSRLKNISVRDRVMAFLSEAPVPAPPSVIERLMQSPPIVCDLCDQRADPSSLIWTCENGSRTVLHAVAYDVCEACFHFYAHGTHSPHAYVHGSHGGQEYEDEYGDEDEEGGSYLHA